eukprot:TRINITY_DN39466_c0_g1_i1.p1 TRINITY_DN39466_c0_g1~~TRINITY_DN39466_c0_g1_i1.p1  ORF type:complete len:306 (+),score=63.87 TRINITY_DN39466_c0_g1_i1:90-1007(+)
MMRYTGGPVRSHRVVLFGLVSTLLGRLGLTFVSYSTPCWQARSGRRLRHSTRRIALLEELFEGRELLRSMEPELLEYFKNAPDGNGGRGQAQLGMPEETDIGEITELLEEGFSQAFEGRLDAEKLGILAMPWNAARGVVDRGRIGENVKDRLQEMVALETFEMPDDRSSVAFIVRGPEAAGSKLLAYLELCILPIDGKRQDEYTQIRFGSADGPVEPYLSNIVVAASARRQGLGKAMVRIAEHLAKTYWKRDWLYLHADCDGPAQQLYLSAGYQGADQEREDGALHMRKYLGDEELYDYEQEEDS